MPSSINKGSWTRNLFRISFSKIKYCKSIFRMKKSKIYENKHLWKRPLYLYLNFWYLSNFLVFFVILLFNSFNSSRSSSDWDSSFSLPNSVRNFLYLFSSFTYSAPPLFSLKNDSSALNDPTFQHRRNNWTSYKHVKILPDWATMIGFFLLSFIWFLGFIFLFDFISWFLGPRQRRALALMMAVLGILLPFLMIVQKVMIFCFFFSFYASDASHFFFFFWTFLVLDFSDLEKQDLEVRF